MSRQARDGTNRTPLAGPCCQPRVKATPSGRAGARRGGRRRRTWRSKEGLSVGSHRMMWVPAVSVMPAPPALRDTGTKGGGRQAPAVRPRYGTPCCPQCAPGHLGMSQQGAARSSPPSPVGQQEDLGGRVGLEGADGLAARGCGAGGGTACGAGAVGIRTWSWRQPLAAMHAGVKLAEWWTESSRAAGQEGLLQAGRRAERMPVPLHGPRRIPGRPAPPCPASAPVAHPRWWSR